MLRDSFNFSASLADLVVLVLVYLLVCLGTPKNRWSNPLQLNIRFKSLNLYQLMTYEIVGDRELYLNAIRSRVIFTGLFNLVYANTLLAW